VKIGPYTVLGVLGEGGMGRVYLGRTDKGARVALKVIRSDLAADREFRARFRQEIDAASRVRSPRTVAVLGADPDAESPWLATEYVPAPSLRDAVADHGPLPADAVRLLGVGLAEALEAIHGAGVVHRDLKPPNVLLADDGPRVIDFGIARAADATAVTRTGTVIGTPGYIAPEQITHGGASPEADVFGLGGLLLHAATGRAPFGTGDAAAVLYRVLHVDPDLSGVPPRIAPTVAACLDRDPARRPHPRQVREALTAGAVATPGPGWLPAPTTAPPPLPPPVPAGPSRSSRSLAAAALVLLAVAGLGAMFSLGGDRLPPTPTSLPTPTATPATPTAAPSTPPVSTAPTSTPPPVAEQVFADATGFSTPSGNIACLVAGAEARCDIVDSAWPDDVRPGRPPDCAGAFGDALAVSGTDRGDFVCHGDTVLGSGPTLDYGQAIRVGGTACTSRESGVECRVDATRHGFSISRTRYTLF
jgi:eukaryotic-like serine/threonine-protein kinase